ncbi:LytR/AlgR family response regulator transcription factor [Streptomonospora salina]|uniref:DNA-binding LytR/AlgR family response regulator n=1 Tax=Streptomonospora salina TaxID=104205 RepID=A0A841ECK3_9ACTN|nr:LytTR family DNA-binding domain-containing protein [Streptomonospora salina]MBB6000716.1 DNA-binding LytR/AlgR family response regulator [Streptomonospora salina]
MRARCLIVDDEAPARADLRYLLSRFDHVQVVGEASNSEEALLLLDSLDYDLVLMDIRMPGGTGLDVARKLREADSPPRIIFTTAFPDYAVEAFDLDAADYLVKPFDADRLARALDRALATRPEEAEVQAVPRRSDGTESPHRIPVHKGDRTVLLNESSIIYAGAARGYSYLQLSDERVLVNFSLNELERRLHGSQFFRAHRSYLVNLDYVRELAPDFRGTLMLLMDDPRKSRVEVSRRQARELRRVLGM